MKIKKEDFILELINKTITEQRKNLDNYDNGKNIIMENIAYEYYLALEKIKETLEVK